MTGLTQSSPMVMTQEQFRGLCWKTSQFVRADLSKDLSIISADLKTFRATTEAALNRRSNPTSGSKYPESIENFGQLLENMEKGIATMELAMLEAPKEPSKAVKPPAVAAPLSSSATRISWKTPGDGGHPPEEKICAAKSRSSNGSRSPRRNSRLSEVPEMERSSVYE